MPIERRVQALLNSALTQLFAESAEPVILTRSEDGITVVLPENMRDAGLMAALQSETGKGDSFRQTPEGFIVLYNADTVEVAKSLQALTNKIQHDLAQEAEPHSAPPAQPPEQQPAASDEFDFVLGSGIMMGDARQNFLETRTGIAWKIGNDDGGKASYLRTAEPLANPTAARAVLAETFGATNCIISRGHVSIAINKVPIETAAQNAIPEMDCTPFAKATPAKGHSPT